MPLVHCRHGDTKIGQKLKDKTTQPVEDLASWQVEDKLRNYMLVPSGLTLSCRRLAFVSGGYQVGSKHWFTKCISRDGIRIRGWKGRLVEQQKSSRGR